MNDAASEDFRGDLGAVFSSWGQESTERTGNAENAVLLVTREGTPVPDTGAGLVMVGSGVQKEAETCNLEIIACADAQLTST